MKLDVSLIICTWNNYNRLRVMLSSLLQCDVPLGLRWEVVLVNNNCTDETDAVAAGFRGKLPLVYVHELTQGLSRARNKGLSVATGSLIIFTDDDVRPCPDWITTYWNAYRERPYGFFFGGPLESEFEAEPPHRELLDLAPCSVKGFSLGDRQGRMNGPIRFLGANWACPRAALDSVGDFDTSLGLGAQGSRACVGEENDLQRRLQTQGWQPWYLPQACIWHFVPQSKCILRHIGSRIEASAVEWQRDTMGDYSGQCLGGVPRWLIRSAGESWLRWVRARVRGFRGYREYVEYRRLLGCIRAYRDVR